MTCGWQKNMRFDEPYPRMGDLFPRYCDYCEEDTIFTRTMTRKAQAEMNRIAEENASGCFQLQLLERNTGKPDIILPEPGLPDMAPGKLQCIRIDIRTGDIGDGSGSKLASDFFPDCVQYSRIGKTQVFH